MRCPPCCPAAARSPTPPRAPRSSRPGGSPTGTLPATPGRDTDAILAAAAAGELARWSSAGSTRTTWPTRPRPLAGLRKVGFLVSLELHRSAVTELADVVLPVAPDAQRAGSYLNWEGRRARSARRCDASGVLPDCRVLDTLAVEMDVDLVHPDPGGRGERAGAARPARRRRARRPVGRRPPSRCGRSASGRRCWRPGASCSTSRRSPCDEPALAGTARPAQRALPTRATARRLGLAAGAPATVRTERGAITLPVVIADMPDGVVWLPTNSPDSQVRGTLGVGHGDLVGVSA